MEKEQKDETLRLLDDAIELLEIGHGGGYPEEVYESIMERYDSWKKSPQRESSKPIFCSSCEKVINEPCGYEECCPTVEQAKSLVTIRKALESAPVYVTKDGTWLNFRPDADKHKGGAMIKIEGDESEAIRAFGEKVETALTALSQIEDALP